MGSLFFEGKVARGRQRGREIGFPTVNIPLRDSSVSGIYAARVKVGEEKYEAAAYADPKHAMLEAHILDFDTDLYGWNIEVELCKKIRESRDFDDVESLQDAIGDDIAKIREYFKN